MTVNSLYKTVAKNIKINRHKYIPIKELNDYCTYNMCILLQS